MKSQSPRVINKAHMYYCTYVSWSKDIYHYNLNKEKKRKKEKEGEGEKEKENNVVDDIIESFATRDICIRT